MGGRLCRQIFENIFGRFRLGHHAFVNGYAETALQARQQFHAPQAVQAQILIQQTVQTRRPPLCGVEFRHHGINALQQRLRRYLRAHILGWAGLLRRRRGLLRARARASYAGGIFRGGMGCQG